MPTRVLVVDDDPLVLFIIGELLAELSFEAYSVGSGAAAIAALNSGGSFDLVVTDVNMPGITGVAVSQAARQLDVNMPVVYVSGYIPAELSSLVLGDPRAVVINKPFTADQLYRSIQTVMQRAGDPNDS